MLSPREYKFRLSNAITKLPSKEQPHFKTALKPTKFTKEIFIPKTFTHRHIIPKNSSCLRNVLVTFNTNYTKDLKLLQTIRKETSAFTRNYNTINNAVGSSNREQIYNELIMKYKSKGFNEANLFPKANVFNQSILLKKDKHFDNIYLVGDKRENKEDRIFVYNANCYMNKQAGGVRSSSDINSDDDDDEGNVNDDGEDASDGDTKRKKGSHKKNALSLPQVSVKDNRKLQKEIYVIEKLVKEGNREEMRKTLSTCDGEGGNGNQEAFRRVKAVDEAKQSKGSRNVKIKINTKADADVDVDVERKVVCKSNTTCNMDVAKKKQRHAPIASNMKKCGSENEGVYSKRKGRKRKIIKGSLSDREVMYNKLTKNGYSASEDRLIRYLERTQKGSYDKVK